VKSIKETASILGISDSTLRGMVNRKEIGHHRIGGKIQFSDEDIAEFLATTHVPRKEKGEPKLPPRPIKLKHLSLK
jgi:excisionase family DNA binding protein